MKDHASNVAFPTKDVDSPVFKSSPAATFSPPQRDKPNSKPVNEKDGQVKHHQISVKYTGDGGEGNHNFKALEDDSTQNSGSLEDQTNKDGGKLDHLDLLIIEDNPSYPQVYSYPTCSVYSYLYDCTFIMVRF